MNVHRRPRRWVLSRAGLVTAVMVVLLAGLVGWITHEIRVMRAQLGAMSVALTEQRGQAADAGLTPVAPPPEEILRNPQPGPKGERGEQGPPGRDATDDQVRRAVEAYFARNPPRDGRAPTPAEIALAVVNYLTEHPPAPGKDGKNASAEQIAAAVRDYLADNPPPAGPKGEKGEQGPGPTAQQIADQVEAYLNAHPLPLCPSGSHIEEYKPLTDGRTFLVCTKD